MQNRIGKPLLLAGGFPAGRPTGFHGFRKLSAASSSETAAFFGRRLRGWATTARFPSCGPSRFHGFGKFSPAGGGEATSAFPSRFRGGAAAAGCGSFAACPTRLGRGSQFRAGRGRHRTASTTRAAGTLCATRARATKESGQTFLERRDLLPKGKCLC